MNTNTLTTRTGKQFLGAVGGMAAATAIYLIIQQFSALNLQGALVETVPMSDNPQQIRVSDKNIDDEALAVLQRRARQVTAALGQTQSAASQPSVLAENSAYRRQVRLTAANLAVRVPSSAATTVAATTASSTAVSSEAIVAVAQSAPLHSGAPLEQTPTATALPSSGLGTQALALFTLVLAFAVAHTGLRDRVVALLGARN